VFDGLHNFLKSIQCERGIGDKYNALTCIEGTCEQCGHLSLLPTCNTSSHMDKIVQWRRFTDVNTLRPDGAMSRRPTLTIESTPFRYLDSYMRSSLLKYVGHTFRQTWLARQFKGCKEDFPIGTIVSVIDFAENYSFQPQDEIQSMHWFNVQVTLLVHITYRHAQLLMDGIESTETERHVVKECHFYVSDDKIHDTLFVQHCFKLHYDWLASRGIKFSEHVVWSDGCAGMQSYNLIYFRIFKYFKYFNLFYCYVVGQFKSSRSFYWMTRYYSITGIRMTWSFFESGHGKGEHDGAGKDLENYPLFLKFFHAYNIFIIYCRSLCEECSSPIPIEARC